MSHIGLRLFALLLGLLVCSAGFGGWGAPAYRTTLLTAAAPGPGSARFVLLDGYRASAPPAGTGLRASVAAHSELGVLAAALDSAVAGGLLTENAPVTLLAPTDSAFAALPAPQRNALLSDPARLAGLLRAHLVEGRLTARELAGRNLVTTLDGRMLDVDRREGMRVGGGRVILADIAAGSALIHLVDCVLTQPCGDSSAFPN